MDEIEVRRINRGKMEWTTAYLEASRDPLHQELLFIITQGNKTPKGDKKNEQQKY